MQLHLLDLAENQTVTHIYKNRMAAHTTDRAEHSTYACWLRGPNFHWKWQVNEEEAIDFFVERHAPIDSNGLVCTRLRWHASIGNRCLQGEGSESIKRRPYKTRTACKREIGASSNTSTNTFVQTSVLHIQIYNHVCCVYTYTHTFMMHTYIHTCYIKVGIHKYIKTDTYISHIQICNDNK